MANLFKTKTPEVAAPTPLPDEEQATVARRRGVAKEKAKSGVASTILSAGSRETLGS